MKKPIAIIFSDLHLNLWSRFNENNQRTLNHFKVLSVIKKICKSNGYIPALFCGDLFHKPETMDNSLLSIFVNKSASLGKSNKFHIIAISGNHDLVNSNGFNKKSDSWVRTLSQCTNWLKCIDFTKAKICNGKVNVYGIPYIDNNKGLTEYINNLKLDGNVKNILILHTDYPGAKDTDGREVGSVENLNVNVLSKFDLVICGHIHKPQRLSKKVYMIGAPLQQRRTDKNSKLGYWELYSDMSMKFVELTNFPKFIDVESEEDIQDDGNYYTVISKEDTQPESENKIHNGLSKKKLVRLYLKYNNIRDKEKKDCLLGILKQAEDYD